MIERFRLSTKGQGLTEVTRSVSAIVENSGIDEGLCTVFVRHTSCSLVIQENADPSAQHDLENWMNRLVPEGDSLYTHIYEGRDDMPAHIKSALTATQLSVPFQSGKMLLGTWQGIFLWEHRHSRHERELVVHLSGT